MENENSEMMRIALLGLLDEDGQNSVILQLFPSAISRLMAAADWAKANPQEDSVEIVLHGEKPHALIMTMPRATLLSMVADMERREQGITLQ
jgi:carbamoylphosphate synthase large subunit